MKEVVFLELLFELTLQSRLSSCSTYSIIISLFEMRRFVDIANPHNLGFAQALYVNKSQRTLLNVLAFSSSSCSSSNSSSNSSYQ